MPLGDKGYLVTYRKTDPLCVLNLSEPTDPVVEGELEIDGYSDFLYPVGNDLLIGICKNAIVEEVNGWEAAWYQGMKLSLIDPHAYAQLNLDRVTRITLPVKVYETTSDYPYYVGAAREYFYYTYTGLFKYEIDLTEKTLTQVEGGIKALKRSSSIMVTINMTRAVVLSVITSTIFMMETFILKIGWAKMI